MQRQIKRTTFATDNIAKGMADDFRRRRIEKGLTRDRIAELSGVAVSNIVRFEQKGLISLKNLIGIAIALGYTSEVRHVFSEQKYSTMEELLQIHRNTNKIRHIKDEKDITRQSRHDYNIIEARLQHNQGTITT